MLTGKVALITGAGSGIGRHMALLFAAQQATVIAADVDPKALEGLTDEASKFGFDVVPEVIDVTDFEALTALRDRTLSARKRLDVWVNNAGIAGMGPFPELTPAQFDRVIAINLHALVNGTRLALETMETQGSGTIVNMASVAGHLAAPFMTAYTASKFAVVGFTRALRAELRLKDSPVKILLVSPGFVETAIINKGGQHGFPEWLSFLLSRPEAVAKEILAAIEDEKEEIVPTLNGKLMKNLGRFLPKTTERGSKLFLAKSWKDALLNRITLEEPRRTKSGSDPNS